jgi:hypothetical protein
MKPMITSLVLLLCSVTTAWAGSAAKVSSSCAVKSSHKVSVKKHHHSKKKKATKVGSVTLYSGSLRDNISRIAKDYGWKKVVWLPNSDYQWVGKVTMRKRAITVLFGRVLQGYPLQAVFYKGNHVLVVTPRNI